MTSTRASFRYDSFTVPNLVTYARTAVCCVLALAVLVDPDMDRSLALGLTIAAFAAYWFGDMLDGLSARLLDQETRGGALLDTLCDRACVTLATAAACVLLEPPLVPVALYLFNFLLLDFWLSLRFVDHEIDTNNHFYAVDETVYRVNWSPPAKATNSAFVLLLVLLGPVWLSVPAVVALIAVKSWSWHRLATAELQPRPPAAPADATVAR